MFSKLIVLIFIPLFLFDVETNARDVRLRNMSSAEVKRIEAAAEEIREDKGFESHRKRKLKKHGKQRKTTTTVAPTYDEATTTVENGDPVPIDIVEEKVTEFKYVGTFAPVTNIFGVPVESMEATEDDNVENLLNESMPDSKHKRSVRSANHDYIGAFLIAANADDEAASVDAQDETAPPDLGEVVQELKSDDDILKQLEASKFLSDSNTNNAHQGGNVRTVDFEEALKVTVPYNSEKFN